MMHNWKNWKEIPIPAKMQGLEKDERGFPIPFIVVRDNQNKPHFTANDLQKQRYVVKNELCGLCGQPCNGDMWMVGGPSSAFHPHGAYIDPFVHHECGKYALQVCPYLAVSKYNTRLDIKGFNQENFGGGVLIQDMQDSLNNRPPFFVFVRISGFKLVGPVGREYIKPITPYLEVEFWNEGNPMDREEGLKKVLTISVEQNYYS